MTAPSSIDPARFLHDQLASASPDLLRSMLTTFIDTLMSAEADAICGAPYGMPGPDRVNVRNGYRHRDSGTRAGTPIQRIARSHLGRERTFSARTRSPPPMSSPAGQRLYRQTASCQHDHDQFRSP
jgi:transposase-like protein